MSVKLFSVNFCRFDPRFQDLEDGLIYGYHRKGKGVFCRLYGSPCVPVPGRRRCRCHAPLWYWFGCPAVPLRFLSVS